MTQLLNTSISLNEYLPYTPYVGRYDSDYVSELLGALVVETILDENSTWIEVLNYFSHLLGASTLVLNKDDVKLKISTIRQLKNTLFDAATVELMVFDEYIVNEHVTSTSKQIMPSINNVTDLVTVTD